MSGAPRPDGSGRLPSRSSRLAPVLDRVFGHASIGMAITDHLGRCLKVNPAYAGIVGHATEELLDRDLVSLTHPADRGVHEQVLQQLLAREIASYTLEQRCLRKGGDAIWVQTDVSLLPGADGQPTNVLVLAHDIQHRKEVEEERARALQERQEAVAEANQLLEISRSFAGHFDLPDLIQLITDLGTGLVGAGFGIFLYNVDVPGGRSQRRCTVSGLPRPIFEDIPIGRLSRLFFRGDGIIRLDDAPADPQWERLELHPSLPAGYPALRSYLAVPVHAGSGRMIGHLLFGHAEPARFTARHERLLQGVAAQAAIAIDNACLVEAERKARAQSAERARLAQLGAQVGSALVAKADLVSALAGCGAAVLEHLGAAGAGVWLWSERDGALLLAATAGADPGPVLARIAPGQGLIGRVAAERTPLAAAPARGDPAAEWMRREGLVALAGHPLAAGERLLGVLAHFHRQEVSTSVLHEVAPVVHSIAAHLDQRRSDAIIAQKASELERSNRDLERFASIASHDMKEPLRTISSYMSLLQRRYGDRLDDQGRQYLQHALVGASRMHRLVEALLAYAQIGAAARPFQEVGLRQVAEEAIEGLRQRIEESGAVVEVGELPVVQGDAVLLTELLQNLIANSLKFRRDGVPARIAIRGMLRGTEAEVAISDNGIGIAPEHQRRVFELFQRLHTREAFEGTGIGLATCRRIAELHRGRIWVESVPGEGACFFVALPAARAP